MKTTNDGNYEQQWQEVLAHTGHQAARLKLTGMHKIMHNKSRTLEHISEWYYPGSPLVQLHSCIYTNMIQF